MADDVSGPIGPVDYPTLRQIRDLLLSEEPLVESARFDDPGSPTELVVQLGTGAKSKGRFEITWWERGAYRYHYTESDGIDFRFDKHPKTGAPDAHFHPPPTAGEAEASFLIDADRPQVVTRAILRRWRRAIAEDGELDEINPD